MPNEIENQLKPERGRDAVSAKPSAEAVAQSRRRFTRAGLAAPVVMSLSSRSVWGQGGGTLVQCLSTQMSGNLSQQGKPPECLLGWAPDVWKDPEGMIDGLNTRDAWAAATGLSADDAYGTIKANQPGNNCNQYENGALFSQAFGSAPGSTMSDPDDPMREFLCNMGNRRERNAVTGWLNASLLDAAMMGHYLLTVQQVTDLYFDFSDSSPLLKGMSFNDFLESTW